MTRDEVLDVFRQAGGLLEGHFILSSGRRSGFFIQKMRVFESPVLTEKLCRALGEKIVAHFGKIDVVVSPAIGGIVPGYEVARALGARAIFVEREDRDFHLRRGFEIRSGERVVVVEDIVTTGLSARECINSLADQPGEIVGAACLIDRSAGKVRVGIPLLALCEFAVPDYDPAELPPELALIPRSSRARAAYREAEVPFPIRLGVNIDHVATLRNARDGLRPDPLRAAHQAIAAGADGITAHLREDRRHIRDADLRRLKDEISRPLNFEMAASEEMVAIACSVLPHACCLVPERREERTTEGGLDLQRDNRHLAHALGALKDAGIRVSLFIEADESAIAAAAALGADIVELHTGTWCHAIEMGDAAMAKAEFARLARGARLADAAGLEVHAGHGLDYASAERLAGCVQFVEFNIGHFLIGEAVFVGLSEAIRQMRHAMDLGRGLVKI